MHAFVMRNWAVPGALACLSVAVGCGTAAPPAPPLAARIMPLGDSITQGNLRFISFRRPLWKQLTDAGYAVDFVGSIQRHRGGWSRTQDYDMDHEGHWGWRIDDIIEELPSWLARTKPEVVLLHLGSNDIFHEEPVEQIVAEWMALLRLLAAQRPPPVVLAARLIPARGREVDIQQLNEALHEEWRNHPIAGIQVRWVDQFSGFDPARDTYDGIHPNAEGEKKIAQRWFDALRAVLPPPINPTI